MAPILYGMIASPAVRSTLLTAKALNIENLEFNEVNLIKGEQLRPEYLKLNPQHTVPVLKDGNLVITESHAINAYLSDKYGKDDTLYPKNIENRAIVNMRLHFDNGILFPRGGAIFKPLLHKQTNKIPQDKAQNLMEAFDTLENLLKLDSYAALSNVTIADFHIVSTLSLALSMIPLDSAKYPKIAAWLRKMEALPYYEEVMKDGIKMCANIVKNTLI